MDQILNVSQGTLRTTSPNPVIIICRDSRQLTKAQIESASAIIDNNLGHGGYYRVIKLNFCPSMQNRKIHSESDLAEIIDMVLKGG